MTLEELDAELEARRRGVPEACGPIASASADAQEPTFPWCEQRSDAPIGWPHPLANATFHGLVGDIVRLIDPHTETDPAALLLQCLVGVGNVVGRNPYFSVEATRHYLNLFVALVGDTAKARKGTSWGHIDRIFTLVDGQAPTGIREPWGKRLVTGLSSGEGLIWEVRDATGDAAGEPDSGVNDKRRIALDGEFASTLKMLERRGNTLSPVIRNAWDSGDLRILTKNSPAQATGAHISIVGHITRDELRRELTATEQGNGFANRFLWCCVRRSKCLPDGGSLRDADLHPLADRLREVVEFAQDVGEMKRDEAARLLWHKVYNALSDGKPGMLGAVTARAEAQVTRLACLYALLDQSSVVRLEHLEAALAVWHYCEASARFIFGDSLGDAVADKILAALRSHPRELTRTEIRDLFQRNQSKTRIDEALGRLEESQLARRTYRQAGKQKLEAWFAR